ncbi:hypothetical protein [Pandoraea oxalativorans]|uniref:Uncharacterized protein n=1 Tax=Pandoraea oxalativorans TaxID=573737 RepID=A0A0G3IC22_9BURK|nr:hypothetical protein [Pandoraea oxalativorans]AKK24749.1 hypothetical protein MB84_28515 [Pandoraea oxalativorans]
MYDVNKNLDENKKSHPIEKEMGNSGEINQVLYHLMKNDSRMNKDFRDTIHLVRLVDPDDHVFICIGDINGDTRFDCSALDHWSRYVDQEDATHWGRGAENPTYGFIGSLEDYKEFLAGREDAIFIKRKNFHHFEKAVINTDTENAYANVFKEIEKSNPHNYA